jgi:hypothetical protein
LAPVEVAEIESRLQNRDPQLDLHRAFPNLIATLRARDAEIRGQLDRVVFAERELRETLERFEGLQIEVTRERAVIESTRRLLAAMVAAAAASEDVLRQYDAGAEVIRL